jgi:hypothetical protein
MINEHLHNIRDSRRTSIDVVLGYGMEHSETSAGEFVLESI